MDPHKVLPAIGWGNYKVANDRNILRSTMGISEQKWAKNA